MGRRAQGTRVHGVGAGCVAWAGMSRRGGMRRLGRLSRMGNCAAAQGGQVHGGES